MAKNAKAKIRRTLKNYGIDLTGDVFIPESIESFGTREGFNKWKESVSSFTNPANLHYQFVKNEQGVAISKAEKNRMEREAKRIQRRTEEFYDKFKDRPFIAGGKETGMTVQDMMGLTKEGTGGVRQLDDFEFDEVKTQEDLERIRRRIEKRADPEYFDKTMKTLKDNFIRSVEGSFNSLADELIEELRKLPPNEFYELFMTYGEIDFAMFDSEGEKVTATEGTIHQIMSYIEEFKRDQSIQDLKGF